MQAGISYFPTPVTDLRYAQLNLRIGDCSVNGGRLPHEVASSGFKTTPEADKPQIRLKSLAQADEKAQHTRQYVSILNRFAIRHSSLAD
jgi:hypothetical protein